MKSAPPVVARRISKRARRDKSLEVVFDESARKEFVTGFRKRKNKRRKQAEEQKKEKERQKRIHDRKERRLQLKKALGYPEEEEKDEHCEEDARPEVETVIYEDDATRTIVSTCPILPEDPEPASAKFATRKRPNKRGV